jgi:hypothetical protein
VQNSRLRLSFLPFLMAREEIALTMNLARKWSISKKRKMTKKKYCIIRVSLIVSTLLSFSVSSGVFDSSSNKELEKRLHNIYVSHYNSRVLDSDWFKIIEAIEIQKHTVQAGDTLWGISKIYFGDGNYWSKLWSVNKNITNPHLIFVGDVISFHTGSFIRPPGIDIEKNSGDLEQNVTDLNLDESKGEIKLTQSVDRPAQMLSSFFKEQPVIVVQDPEKVEFIARPKMDYKSEFFLTNDLLSSRPENLGFVDSLGQYRIVTAERSLIILKSDQNLSEGETYSILKQDMPTVDGGYPVHVQGTVRIEKKIDESRYEARVIKQFEAFDRGAIVSNYTPVLADMDIRGKSPIEVPLKLLTEAQTIWTSGDYVFLKIEDSGSVSPGDLIKINNKFADRIEFYVGNGALKIVTVNPPYATGIVIYSQEHIRANSVSSPTNTGWSIW